MSVITSEYNTIMKSLAHGDYSGAIEALGADWCGAGILPLRNGYDSHDYATLVMYSGILTSELGLMGGNLQEQGKDMLSLSVRLFENDVESAQTARAWLAVAYERCGDFNEALVLADYLLESKDSSLEITVCAAKSKSIALDALGHPEKALQALDEVTSAVEGANSLLQGKVHLQRGYILRKLGRPDESLESFEAAEGKFQDAGSPRYEASASNNMASIYMDRGDFPVAHTLTEKAIRLFQEISDRVHEGAVWDQSAQINRKQGNLCEAEISARKAIALLESSDRLDYLAEAYTTLGSVLVEIGAGAAEPLQKAARIYGQTGNTVLLDSVNGLLWDSILKIKQLAKETSAAMYQSVRPVEGRIIEQVMEKHDWKIFPAANELKLTPRGLREKLKKHFPELYAKLDPVKPRGPRRRSIMVK